MKGFLFGGFAIIIFGLAGVGRADTYTLTDLGPVTNLDARIALAGINLRGFVAETFATNSVLQARLYTGSWTNLGTLGGSNSYADGLNDSNRVVGNSLLADGVTSHAFLWTPGGTNGVAGNPQMQDLGTLGGNNSAAYEVNDFGTVTGAAQNGVQIDHAARWSGGVLTDVGALLPGAFIWSYGYCINNAGHVAGTALDVNYANKRAFFYDGTTAAAPGGFSGGAGEREAFGINESDTIVGYADFGGAVYHAFRQRANVVTDLGTLGQGTYSQADAINNSDEMVGVSTVDLDGTNFHAFIANGNTMTDLNNHLDASGTGWTLVEATAISDYGQIIGVGTSNGLSRGFLLTPLAARVSGSVELQAFAGTSRMVRFVTSAGSGGTNYLQTNDVVLNFSGGLANYNIRVPTNTTHLSAKTAWNLRRRQTLAITNGTATVNFTGDSFKLKGGDLVTVGGSTAIEDSNNAVTSSDYLLLLGYYLQTVSGNSAIERADINGDGAVTSSDYLLLLGNYLTSGDSQ